MKWWLLAWVMLALLVAVQAFGQQPVVGGFGGNNPPGVLVKPQITGGITDGNSFQLLVDQTPCTTPAGSGTTCTDTVTLNVAMVDTTYSGVCQCMNGYTGQPVVVSFTPGTTTSAQITTEAMSNAAAHCTAIFCILVHR